MLAANALPRNPREKRRQRRFLRFLRSTVFYDCIDNTLDEPQLAFIEGIKLNVDTLLCGFIGSHCCFFSEDMVKYLKVCISKENRGIKYNRFPIFLLSGAMMAAAAGAVMLLLKRRKLMGE